MRSKRKTKILKVDANLPDKAVMSFAATLLADGGLVAFPTETVYGIAANFLDKSAVAKLYRVKKRPTDKPFTIHISSVDMIARMGCEIGEEARRLIEKFWPGPLTIILERTSATYEVAEVSLDGNLVGCRGKFGFRMPKSTVAKTLISESGVPVVAPSANLSGGVPPTEACGIPDELDGEIDLILDGGKTEYGKESTIVDATRLPFKILREGAISKDEIESTLE